MRAARAATSAGSMRRRSRSAGRRWSQATSIGLRLRCTSFSGTRATPLARSSADTYRRWAMVAASSVSSGSGSSARSKTMTRLSTCGWRATGATGAAHRRVAGKRCETCSTGTTPAISSSEPANFLSRRRSAYSHRRGCAWRNRRAMPMSARTSDTASCASPSRTPLAAARCSSLNDGAPSSRVGQVMPSGRSACARRITSSRSQRELPLRHSRS